MSNAHVDHQNDLREAAKLYLGCDDECGEDVPVDVLKCEGIVRCCLEKLENEMER